MSQAYRNLQEVQLLAVRQLERRVANLERQAAGQVAIQSKSTGTDSITATATPGTAISGVSITIAKQGRYAALAVFDFSGSVTGWGTANGLIAKNGVEVSPTIRSILGDDGAATKRACVSVFQFLNLVVGDVLTLGALKTVGAGTLVSTNGTHLQVFYAGPT